MSNPTAADYARVDAEHDSMPNEWRHRAARAVAALRAELDAERSAHDKTIHEWNEAAAVRLETITALKARLALAEAVCESAVACHDGVLISGHALAAWRAAK